MVADPDYPPIPDGIQLRTVPDEELVRLTDDRELGLDRTFVEAAIERGDVMFGAYDGDHLVSYVWRSVDSAPHEDGIWVRVKRPYCYSYNSFTRPAYRGMRLSPAAHLYSDTEMLSRRFTHRAGFVSITNLESLAAGKHMGTNPIGYAGYLEMFGRRLFFRSKAVRDIGFEFFEKAETQAD